MATIEVEKSSRTQVAWFVLAGLAAVAAIAVAIGYFNRPPQLGADDDVFKTVDALYTAVRLKDDAKVTQCERRLHAYREAGKLPEASALHLDRIIGKARSGSWESATESLYDFMLAQRREGRGSHSTAGKK